MSMIVNLTQHLVTGEQLAAGVVDIPPPLRRILSDALTFESIPTRNQIIDAAEIIADIAYQFRTPEYDMLPDAAMIGGAMWLMGPLAEALQARGIEPLFAFSQRQSVESTLADGSISKISIFRHVGFVSAIV